MAEIPALDAGCGSWIVTCKATGKAVAELFSARNVGRVNSERYTVEAANVYLARLNATIATARNTLSVRSGLEMGGYEKSPDLYSAKQLHEYVEARERILRARAAELEKDLADCFRLTGADPDGNEDWRLARDAVKEVAAMRTDLDLAEARVAELESVLSETVALYGKPGGPWNIPSDPAGWLERARAAIDAARGAK